MKPPCAVLFRTAAGSILAAELDVAPHKNVVSELTSAQREIPQTTSTHIQRAASTEITPAGADPCAAKVDNHLRARKGLRGDGLDFFARIQRVATSRFRHQVIE